MNRPTAIVTGASAGLGAEFARQLAGLGYDLVLIARREQRLRTLADRLTGIHNISCEVMTADLTDSNDLARVEARIASMENLELLVNNAGFGSLGLFFEAPLEDAERMHRLHVMAPMRLCHAALAGMTARRRGAVINVSSIAGFMASAGSVSYCATKAWMNRFTESLALELRGSRTGVRIQALCPGYTRTEFHQTLAMDTSRIPGWMWLPVERVVRESLDGLRAGKLFVIPGRRYRSGLRAYELMPDSWRRRIGMGSAAFRKPLPGGK